jgi:hypothetical protein
MIWLIIILSISLLLGFLLFSRIVVEVDTRIAKAELRWQGIGMVKVWYEDEWWLSMKVPFYRKTLRFADIKKRSKTPKDQPRKKRNKRPGMLRMVRKAIKLIKTFRVIEYQLAVDTGDNSSNAQLYPLNFTRWTFGHLNINFRDENFLVLKIQNRPWKVLYAFFG